MAAALRPPQLVHPVALGGRRAGSRGNRRSGDEDLFGVGCGRDGRRHGEVVRPLDGWFVAPPQDAQAGGLLLGLRLLLGQQLLVEHLLDVLLRQSKHRRSEHEEYRLYLQPKIYIEMLQEMVQYLIQVCIPCHKKS